MPDALGAYGLGDERVRLCALFPAVSDTSPGGKTIHCPYLHWYLQEIPTVIKYVAVETPTRQVQHSSRERMTRS
jgi:hypothetical protein